MSGQSPVHRMTLPVIAQADGRRVRRGGLLASLVAAGLLSTAFTASLSPAQAQLFGGKGDAQQTLSRAPLSFADIVDKVKPAVVSVYVKSGGGGVKMAQNAPGRTPGAPGGQGGRGNRGGGTPPGDQSPDGALPDLPDDHPLSEFFKRFGKQFKGLPSPEPRMAQGSGFFVSEDGYLVTNNHVIDGAAKIEVSFDEKDKMEAELIGTDSRTDLALLKVKTDKKMPFVKFAAGEPRVGDWVLAVGNPFGLGGTVTAGIVSALARDIGNGPYDFMQIDAAVNRGNSGGPTFNLNGEVVGVNTAIYSPSGGSVGIAFAVPAKLVAQVVEELKSKGTVSRGWLGVNIQNVTEDVASGLGMKEPHGAIVSGVTADGPAAIAGIKDGDAIIALNGEKVADSRDLARKVAGLSPNAAVDVKLIREGTETIVKVQLGTFPGGEKLAKLQQGKSGTNTPEFEQLGLTLAPNTTKKASGSADGVLISEVDPDSEAASKGLRQGDIIVNVGGKAVNSVDEVLAGIKRAKEQGKTAVLMQVRSGGEQAARFVGLSFKKAG